MADPDKSSQGPSRWTWLSLGVALAGGSVALLVWYYPRSGVTFAACVALLIFVLFLFRNPAFWLRRLSQSALAAAAVSGSIPTIDGWFGLRAASDSATETISSGFMVAGSSGVSIALIIAAIVFALLDVLRERGLLFGGSGAEESKTIAAPERPQSSVAGRDQLFSHDGDVAGGNMAKSQTGDAAGKTMAKSWSGDAAGGDIDKSQHYTTNVTAPTSVQPSAVPRQLRRPEPDFVGRDDEIEAILNAVKSGGACLCGVRGMGGIGKTELALTVAGKLAPSYPQGQIFIDLRGADPKQRAPLSAEEVMWHVIRSFDIQRQKPENDDQMAAAYRTTLADHRVLLLYDNAATEAQVHPLIPSDNCVLLVTSRKKLVLPGLTPVDVDKLPREKSRALLTDICERIGDEADAIAELCCDLPMALRIVASTLQVTSNLSPRKMCERLSDKKKRLGAMTAEEQSVEASIALSEAMLPDDESRRRFRALAVFPESFKDLAAAAVWDVEDMSAVRESLALLHTHNLLLWDEPADRYRMHDLVRLFAESRLGAGEHDGLCLRHAEHFRGVLATADGLYLKHGDSTLLGLLLFDTESANIRSAFSWIREAAERDDDVARLCSSFLNAGAYCLAMRLATEERIEWLRTALAAAERLDAEHMIAAQAGNLGLVLQTKGDLDGAEKMHRQALGINEKLDSLEGMANDYGNLGSLLLARGELDDAEAMYRKSLEIEKKLGRLEGMAADYGNLGIVLKKRGDLDGAEAMYRKALKINESLGRQEGIAIQYANLGSLYEKRGDKAKAREYWERALEQYTRLGAEHIVEQVQGWLDELDGGAGDDAGS